VTSLQCLSGGGSKRDDGGGNQSPVGSHQSLHTSHPSLVVFNKPYGVVCQFSSHPSRPTLKQFVAVDDVYPAGRLDWDSEGLVVLTADGRLQHRISDPRAKLPKVYWAQVEGEPTDDALQRLRAGVDLGEFTTLPAEARRMEEPAGLWPREPPIRVRRAIPTAWLELVLREGKNRQVRRMTAAVGHPTLRLIRWRVGPWDLSGLAPGAYRQAHAAGLD
jgi:23S rRNA pseudouridine2457 synthase